MIKKIVLTGGGTAGHVTPNLALVPKLKELGYEIYYVGSKNGIEKQLVEKEKIVYYSISSGKFRRELNPKNISDAFRVIKGLYDAKKLLKEIKPDIVFSKGGFVTVPVIYAAKSLNIPTIIHESDLTLGLANKLSLRKADIACCNFEKTLEYLPDKKRVLTGLPIRDKLFLGNIKQGRDLFGFREEKPIVLIMGGSLGAKCINDVVHNNIDRLLEKYSIVHICGKGKTNPDLNKKQGYVQYEYVGDELADILASSDVVISRAGANAISELVSLEKLNILIPLSKAASRGDQILNAKEFASKGYSVVIEEEMLTIDTLEVAIKEVMVNKDIYIDNMKKRSNIRAVDKIIEIIEEIINKKTSAV